MDKPFYSVHGKTKAVTPALIRIVHVVKLDNRKRESFSVDSGSINLIFIYLPIFSLKLLNFFRSSDKFSHPALGFVSVAMLLLYNLHDYLLG